LLGRKALEAETLKEALGADPLKKNVDALELARIGRFQVKTVAQLLSVARANMVEQLKPSVARRAARDPSCGSPHIRGFECVT
jgi:hypothetical protein